MSVKSPLMYCWHVQSGGSNKLCESNLATCNCHPARDKKDAQRATEVFLFLFFFGQGIK